ncbi:hypothetical protein M0812_13878 [Anaeramoeba flamelloides]|uniref:E2F/DP family winged-helix DNA-binding domain-containing protein n=1 Tax=Anaeramoeba flamelloides TaxID=1746091 RepID=A0AAV7ZKZ1_9EUKA|nr:hypothetical protein M0812_13878 [Anaeramoeba flamelloides]
MTVNFYPLLWKFGKYLEESTIEEELFRFDQKKTKFLNRCLTEEQKNLPRTKRYLDLIQRLLIQNGAFVYPASKKKMTKKLNNTQENTRFSLSPVWSLLFERDLSTDFYFLRKEDGKNVQDKEEVNFHKLSRSKSKKEKKYSKYVENSRSNRTIGILGFKMMKLLKENPHTREDLVLRTEFSKQRVCTVLSIYKLLKLVVEDPKTNLFYWNTEQALLIPDLTEYLQDLLQAKNIKRILARKVQQLSQNLLEKIKEKKGINSRERNIGDQIHNVIERKLESAKSEEIKMKIEIEKNTIRDILGRLVKRKEKLLQFGQNKVKFEKLSSIKIPSSYSCNNFNYSKNKKFGILNSNNGNKKMKNKLRLKTKRNNNKKKKYLKEREFKKRLKKKFQYSKDTNSLYLKKKKKKKQLLNQKSHKKKLNKYYIKQKKKNKLKRALSDRKIKKIIVIKNRSIKISTRPQLRYNTKKKKTKTVQKKLDYSTRSGSGSGFGSGSISGSGSDSVPDLQFNSFSDSFSDSGSVSSSSIESSQSYDLKTIKKKKIKKRIQRKKRKDKKENSDNQTSVTSDHSADNQSLTNQEIQQLLTLDYDFNFEIENDNNEYDNGVRNLNDNDDYDYNHINSEYSIYYSSQIPFEIPQPTIESLNYFENPNIHDDSNSLLLQNDLFETSINKMIPIKNLFETQSFNLINTEYENQNSPFLSINGRKKNNHHSSYLKCQIEWDTDNQFKD